MTTPTKDELLLEHCGIFGLRDMAQRLADALAEVERLRSDLNTSDATAAEFQRMVESDVVEIDRLRALAAKGEKS